MSQKIKNVELPVQSVLKAKNVTADTKQIVAIKTIPDLITRHLNMSVKSS